MNTKPATGILYIAEKPLMAIEIAKCLPGAISRKDGYIETDNGIVTWAVGHILQQADPAEYNPKYKDWIMADLPIIPDKWKLIVTPSCAKQFGIVKKLISEATEIIHAGDPDREGQLLIDEILEYVGNTKPVRRLLLNALDEKTIRRSLGNLRDNKDFYNLQQSALARSRADWLIGMNLSRAYTLAARQAGHDMTLPIGRVKTPTLALVVRREQEIKEFKPLTYWLLKFTFLSDKGKLDTIWQPKDEQSGLDSEGRLVDKTVLDEILTHIRKAKEENRLGLVSNVVKEKKTVPQCLPFSLSALQLQAGKIFGYDPQTVLDTAQLLYEKKLTSYPRSDCDYLPESQLGDAENILTNLKGIAEPDLAAWASGANISIKSRAWNDDKITAHHAIIPTETVCNYDELPEKEKNIYLLIARAYIAQFYPVHEYEHTKIEVTFAEETFKATGNVIINDGWKSLYRRNTDKNEEEKEDELLPAVIKDESVEYMVCRPEEKQTTPPKRFTPSTLLQAMKEIHKYVKNPELKKQLKDVAGIGTEATRAGIIKELQDKGFMQEVKKYLQPTDQANLLLSLLPDEMTYPDVTAEWEDVLDKMKDGKAALHKFIKCQADFVKSLCQAAGAIEVQAAISNTCPVCQAGLLKRKKGPKGFFWGCSKWPDCNATFPDKSGKPDLAPPKEYDCPKCGKGKLRQRSGSKGKFWGCNNYPECKATFEDKRGKPEIHICPTCQKGTLRKIPGKNGDFWGCGNYPNCKATFADTKGKPDIGKKEGKK